MPLWTKNAIPRTAAAFFSLAAMSAHAQTPPPPAVPGDYRITEETPVRRDLNGREWGRLAVNSCITLRTPPFTEGDFIRVEIRRHGQPMIPGYIRWNTLAPADAAATKAAGGCVITILPLQTTQAPQPTRFYSSRSQPVTVYASPQITSRGLAIIDPFACVEWLETRGDRMRVRIRTQAGSIPLPPSNEYWLDANRLRPGDGATSADTCRATVRPPTSIPFQAPFR